MSTGELILALVTGGGLAVVGTVLGALITQTFTIRLGRENRREARRLAVKSFQRDTLVLLQDAVLALIDLDQAVRHALDASDADHGDAVAKRGAAALRVRMLASRVRDENLRSRVHELLEADEAIWQRDEGSRKEGARLKILPRDLLQRKTASMRAIYDRAGELIRSLDEIDAAE
jgi:hypothetical protein